MKFLVQERDASDIRDHNIFKNYDNQIVKVKAHINEIYSKITQGIILCSRANWIEMGEKPTSYFLSLEKYNHNKRVIQAIRNPETQQITRNENEILQILNKYYESLYSDKRLDFDPDYLALLNIPQISTKHKLMLDGCIQLRKFILH